MKKIFWLMLSVSLVACTSDIYTNKAGNTGSGIVGGELVLEDDELGKSVVAIFDRVNNYVCTGTLISENLVMTAAHCVQGTNARDLSLVFHTDMNWPLSAKEQDVIQAHIRNAEKYIYHEEYENFSLVGDAARNILEGSYDIALIKIRGTLPEGYKPIEILADDSSMGLMSKVLLYGYGVTKVVSTPMEAGQIPTAEQIEYGEVYCEEETNECFNLSYEADDILRKTETSIIDFTANEFILDERKQGTCSGDSGGPAFALVDGKYYLYGVTSRGSILCSTDGVYGNLAFFSKWIKETSEKLVEPK